LLLALALLPAAAGLTLAWLLCGLSWWSGALSLGLALLCFGLLSAARRSRAAKSLSIAGLILILGPRLWRAVFARAAAGVRLTTLPGDRGTRLVNTLYPESDGSLAAAGLIGLTGGLRDDDAGRFREILAQAYQRMNPAAASLPTPAIATYLGWQSPSDFDTIVIAPTQRGAPPTAGLIFLHGFAGNFYVYCWEVAQAASVANLITLCPSVDARGAWWTPRGEATLQKTLDYARSIGIQRVYLAGLSNGAAGASVFALAHQTELSGLILISGMRAEEPPALPVLVVQGSTDRMMPAQNAREYAARSSRVRYHEVTGGHLVFLSKHEQIRPLIADFLNSLERAR
jgi:alpha/beta superfamily hydrolase